MDNSNEIPKWKAYLLYIWSIISMFFYSLINPMPTREDEEGSNNRQQGRTGQNQQRRPHVVPGHRYRSRGGG